MKENIQYNSIDLLKFIMALLVVMIHVQPNQHSETLSEIFNNLTSIAVPVFFVISSMFVFHKVNGGHFCLLSYCKPKSVIRNFALHNVQISIRSL